jgi:Glyoxalase-like domain
MISVVIRSPSSGLMASTSTMLDTRTCRTRGIGTLPGSGAVPANSSSAERVIRYSLPMRFGQAMPDGRRPEPGGWNRIQLQVDDLAREVQRLRNAGAHFRNAIVAGQGGKQVLLDDPAGNPIELFEPPRKSSRRARKPVGARGAT